MKSRFNSAARMGVAATSVLAMGLLAGCGGGGDDTGGDGGGGGESPAASNTLEQIREEGTIKVGIAGEIPYSYMEDGELKGGSVAIAREVFGNLGIENVEAELVDWNSLIPGLNAGRYDAISAGMSILPERCEQAAFSDPTIMYTTALMVQEGNPMGLSDLQSVVESQEDVQLAVLAGGIEAGYAESLGIENVQSVPDAQTGMDTVANGRADAFAMTAISLNTMAENNPDVGVEVTQPFVAVIDGEEQIGSGGTVFRQDDTELLEAFNEELRNSVTADEQTYLDVVGEYGFTAENLPPEDLTTEQLCSGEVG